MTKIFTTIIILFTLSYAEARADATFQTHCQLCDNYGMGFVCDVEELNDLSGIIVDSLSNVKSSFQVDEYIDCYMKNRSESKANQWREDYFNEYRDYIKATSQAFRVPTQLLQCAFLKESVYDKGVRNSSAGAQGLCQIMPNTREHVNGIISSANQRQKNGQIDKVRQQVADGAVKEIDQDYFTTLIKQDDFLYMWNENFDNLIERGKYPYDSRPTAFSTVGVKMPQNCIAAAGLYFRDIMTRLSFDFEPTSREEIISKSNNGYAATDLMLVLGAAYNAGPGNVNKIIRKVSPPLSLDKIVKNLEQSSNKEMVDYMKSLKNCLEPGNFDPPARWYSEGGSKPPQCNDEKLREKKLDLLPVRFWANE